MSTACLETTALASLELPSGPQTNKIYLPIPHERIGEAVARGAMREGADSVYVHRRQDLEPFQDLLPSCERNPPDPVVIDLIPKSAWGASLARMVTKPCWGALRLPVLYRFGARCELCGERGGELAKRIGDRHQIECHEAWSYHEGIQASMGVQRLERLMSLCSDCHLMFHLGFAAANGVGDEAAGRLAAANRWSETIAIGEIDNIWATWRARSAKEWAQDYSLLNGTCLFLRKCGEADTAIILGVSFRTEGEDYTYGPIATDEFYARRTKRADDGRG